MQPECPDAPTPALSSERRGSHLMLDVSRGPALSPQTGARAPADPVSRHPGLLVGRQWGLSGRNAGTWHFSKVSFTYV